MDLVELANCIVWKNTSNYFVPNASSPSVLLINRVFPPANGATGQLLDDLASDLVARGWNVTVLTSAVSGANDVAITESGVMVYRVSGLPLSRSNHGWRAIAYGSLYPQLLVRALRLPAHDVVVTKTDPPLQFVLGPIIRWVKGSAIVHWAQDLYPEVAEAMDVFNKEGVVAEAFRGLSNWALHRHDQVVAVGRCMEQRLRTRGIEPNQITVIPNWPPDSVHPIPPEDNPFRTQHGLQDSFVVMYSGNMGLAHPFESMIAAAEHLQGVEPDVRFVFVGRGPRRSWIEAQVENRVLDNVLLLPYQPKERLAESLSAADLHLVSMRHDTKGLVVPSKIYGVMAAARPCLFLGPPESEGARVIDQHQCGEVLSNPSGDELAQRIIEWKKHPRRRTAAGRRASNGVRSARKKAADHFEDLFLEVI